MLTSPRSYIAVAVTLVALMARGETPATRPVGPPSTRPSRKTLSIDGETTKPVTFTRPQLAALPHVEVHVTDHDGHPAVYSGVLVGSLLKDAGVPLGGHRLRGGNQALFLVAEAPDDYRVVISLAELDADFTDKQIIVADKRDGDELDQVEGPFRLIVPGDKLPGRWVRNVYRLHVERVTAP